MNEKLDVLVEVLMLVDRVFDVLQRWQVEDLLGKNKMAD